MPYTGVLAAQLAFQPPAKGLLGKASEDRPSVWDSALYRLDQEGAPDLNLEYPAHCSQLRTKLAYGTALSVTQINNKSIF